MHIFIVIILIVVIVGVYIYFSSNTKEEKFQTRPIPKQIISINNHFPSCTACSNRKNISRINNPILDTKFKKDETIMIIPDETPPELLIKGVGLNGVKPEAPIGVIIATGKNKIKENFQKHY